MFINPGMIVKNGMGGTYGTLTVAPYKQGYGGGMVETSASERVRVDIINI